MVCLEGLPREKLPPSKKNVTASLLGQCTWTNGTKVEIIMHGSMFGEN